MKTTFAVATILTFAACSKPEPKAQAQPTEAVVAPASAPDAAPFEIRAEATEPSRTAPSGKASVTHLAKGKNAYLGKLTMAPGAKVPAHRDATEEYIYFLEGGGKITIDGTTSDVSAGSAVYMPADAEVSYENGDNQSVVVQVFAGPEPSEKYTTWQVVGE